MSNTSPYFRFFAPEKRSLRLSIPGSFENGTSDPTENNGVVIPMPRRKFSDVSDEIDSLPRESPAMLVSARTVYVPTAELPRLLEEWIDSSIGGARSERILQERVLQERVGMMSRFLWFLNRKDEARCGLAQLRKFFVYLKTGHQKPEDHWGQGEAYGGRKPMRPVSQATYCHLRAFFYWLVAEKVIPLSPMSRIEQPSTRTDQPEYFTPEQSDALLKAAKRTRYPLRDTALIWFLLDTGVRASECCSIDLGDLDLIGVRAQVTGKGDKKRTVCFRSTTRLLPQGHTGPKMTLRCSKFAHADVAGQHRGIHRDSIHRRSRSRPI